MGTAGIRIAHPGAALLRGLGKIPDAELFDNTAQTPANRSDLLFFFFPPQPVFVPLEVIDRRHFYLGVYCASRINLQKPPVRRFFTLQTLIEPKVRGALKCVELRNFHADHAKSNRLPGV
jgi:hypothetical protein